MIINHSGTRHTVAEPLQHNVDRIHKEWNGFSKCETRFALRGVVIKQRTINASGDRQRAVDYGSTAHIHAGSQLREPVQRFVYPGG